MTGLEFSRLFSRHELVDLSNQRLDFAQAVQTEAYESIQSRIKYFMVANTMKPNEIKEARELLKSYYEILNKNLHRDMNILADELLIYYEDYLKNYGTLDESNKWFCEMISLCIRMEIQTSSLVRRAQQQILANYSKDISLSGIAEELGVNPNYLSRVFSKESSMRFFEYLNKIRIEAAIHLMEKGNYKLYELAELVGYNNVEHFSRVFKKTMKVSPRDYFN